MEVAPDKYVLYRTALEEIAARECEHFACEVGNCPHGHNEEDPDCVKCGDDVLLHYDLTCSGDPCTARRALAGVNVSLEETAS